MHVLETLLFAKTQFQNKFLWKIKHIFGESVFWKFQVKNVLKTITKNVCSGDNIEFQNFLKNLKSQD